MQKFCTLLALLAAVTFLPSRLQAQAAGNSGQDNTPSANTTTVTGCLEAGKKAGHYMLAADDGTTYHLRSRDVILANTLATRLPSRAKCRREKQRARSHRRAALPVIPMGPRSRGKVKLAGTQAGATCSWA